MCVSHTKRVGEIKTLYNYSSQSAVFIKFIKLNHKYDDPPPLASSKFNDPPLCEGSKSSDPPPICSDPPHLPYTYWPVPNGTSSLMFADRRVSGLELRKLSAPVTTVIKSSSVTSLLLSTAYIALLAASTIFSCASLKLGAPHFKSSLHSFLCSRSLNLIFVQFTHKFLELINCANEVGTVIANHLLRYSSSASKSGECLRLICDSTKVVPALRLDNSW